jgi:chromosomal replication initiation ATPase DnaA
MPPEQLILEAARIFDVPLDALIGRSRRQHVAWARQATMLVLRKRTQLSLVAIGMLFDGRDHSTVTFACDAAEARAAEDPDYGAKLQALLGVTPPAQRADPHPRRRRPDTWWIGLAEYLHRGTTPTA